MRCKRAVPIRNPEIFVWQSICYTDPGTGSIAGSMLWFATDHHSVRPAEFKGVIPAPRYSYQETRVRCFEIFLNGHFVKMVKSCLWG
jgi:hypothetical protein